MLFASPSLAQLSTEFLDEWPNPHVSPVFPVDIDPAEEMPPMLCFHGGSGTAEDHHIGDLRDKVDEERFLLVYPQALPDPNDDGSTNWQVVTSGDLPYTDPNPHSDIDFVSSRLMNCSRNTTSTLHGSTPWDIRMEEDLPMTLLVD